MWLLYQLLFGLVLLLSSPFLLLSRGSHYLATLRGRLGGHDGATQRDALWIHAVSVGEVGVAATLAGALTPETPLLITTVTPTGQERARATLSKRAAVAYLPFDLGFALRRFLRRFSPDALVLIEGEYWPLTLELARRQGMPVAVVNGRVSDRSYRRMRRLRPLLGPLFRRVDRFAMQTDQDRQRLIDLGVPADRVFTTGNLKFETPEPPPAPELGDWARSAAEGRPILVAGSTMRGEEKLVLEAFRRAGGGERALLILAPRHPERWGEVEELLRRAGLSIARRSEAVGSAPVERPDVLLLDTLGELAGLYRFADSAFIGGTLVPTGGHNPLEAARFGVPVVVGPSMDNFREIATIFDDAGAWRRVAGQEELADVWRSWASEPESAEKVGRRGVELIDRHRGALDRTLALLEPILEAVE